MSLSRRDFIKVFGASTGAVLLHGVISPEKALASSAVRPVSGGKAMLYDTSKCVGCRACQNACKSWNKTPAESIGYGGIYDNPPELSASTWTLIKAREIAPDGNKELLFCRYQCMHCTEASCESVCPTGAISHRGAAVIIDQEICIGCGYCVHACPFDVPHKDHGIAAGPAKKCTFCIDRQADGLQPACVEACPAGVLQFGERAELITLAKTRVESLKSDSHPKANLYGEHELGGLHALNILLQPPSVYGLRETPQLATSRVGYQWLSGIITAGVVAVVPFWFLFRRKKQPEAMQSNVEGDPR